MTFKTMINDVQAAVGLPVANSIITSDDTEIKQLVAIANREGRELRRRYLWEAIRKENTFTSVAQEEQTDAFTDIEFDRFVPETMYNRTRTRRVVGPLTPEEWAAQKSLTASVLTDAFIIRDGKWLSTPVPAAGDTYAFTYISKNWVLDSEDAGGVAWTADTDTGILDEDLMGLGITWRWLKAQGLDYAEDFATYQQQVAQAIINDGTKRTMDFGSNSNVLNDKRPPTVPEGSWAL